MKKCWIQTLFSGWMIKERTAKPNSVAEFNLWTLSWWRIQTAKFWKTLVKKFWKIAFPKMIWNIFAYKTIRHWCKKHFSTSEVIKDLLSIFEQCNCTLIQNLTFCPKIIFSCKRKHFFYFFGAKIQTFRMILWPKMFQHENSNCIYTKEAKTHVDPVHPTKSTDAKICLEPLVGYTHCQC